MAGEVRKWLPGLPMVERPDYIDSPYFSAGFKVQILEYKVTPFCRLEIGYNPLFGHLMFIDGEIQISEADYRSFHAAMLESSRHFTNITDLAPRILVIGDGDGGFTKVRTGAKKIDVVERDRDVIAAGERYFGADWSKITLHQMSLAEFEPDDQYDVVVLAVDDGFNVMPEFEAQLDRIASWLAPGGKIVAQAGTDLDPKHPMIFERYRLWARQYGYAWARHQVFVRCYFCHENFFVAEKR